MEHGLAKELKYAGFPGSEDWVEVSTIHGPTFRDVDAYGVPTLSQLIEACGDDLLTLQGVEKKWDALYGSGANVKHIKEADTPEEAVARLWLALNKVG